METVTAQSVAIPRLGFGTFRMPGADAQPVVESALALGYRHIDTAAMYENEAAVGAAIAASGVARDELFVTTKVWHDQLAPDALHRAFDISLRKLGLDHVDLYMIHWPARDMDMAATLEALMSLRERGLTRAMGVCNFNLPMLRRALEEIDAPIASVQLEYHSFLSQAPMLAYLREKGIPLPKLKLTEILDDKPVKVTVELPAKLHRDLVAYAQVLSEEKGSPITDPVRLIAPMLERFMATDRAFAKARRSSHRDPTLASSRRALTGAPSCEQD